MLVFVNKAVHTLHRCLQCGQTTDQFFIAYPHFKHTLFSFRVPIATSIVSFHCTWFVSQL